MNQGDDGNGGDLNSLAQEITARGNFTAREEDGVILATQNESGSEFVIESFGNSVQIRQGVWFNCSSEFGDDMEPLYETCSRMNFRFSGCKSLIDQWGVLITAADVLEPVRVETVEVVLGQVEYVSLAMLDLAEIVKRENRVPTDTEFDAALEATQIH